MHTILRSMPLNLRLHKLPPILLSPLISAISALPTRPFCGKNWANTNHLGSLKLVSSPLPIWPLGRTYFLSDKKNSFSDNPLQKVVLCNFGKTAK